MISLNMMIGGCSAQVKVDYTILGHLQLNLTIHQDDYRKKSQADVQFQHDQNVYLMRSIVHLVS
jgi:hypothetical protein